MQTTISPSSYAPNWPRSLDLASWEAPRVFSLLCGWRGNERVLTSHWHLPRRGRRFRVPCESTRPSVRAFGSAPVLRRSFPSGDDLFAFGRVRWTNALGHVHLRNGPFYGSCSVFSAFGWDRTLLSSNATRFLRPFPRSLVSRPLGRAWCVANARPCHDGRRAMDDAFLPSDTHRRGRTGMVRSPRGAPLRASLGSKARSLPGRVRERG